MNLGWLRRTVWRVGHRARATATFAAAAATVSIVLGVVAFTSSRAYLTDQRENGALDRAYLNAKLVRDQLRGRQADPGAALAALIPEEGATALVLIDGEWYASSVAVEADDLPEDVLAETAGGRAAWRRYSLRGTPHLAVAVPIPAVDAVYAEVTPLRQLDETLGTLRSSLLVAAVATTVVGGFIGFAAAGRLVRPLRKLAERAEAIAAGAAHDLDEPPADPELAPLVASLNRLIDGHARRAERDSRFVSDVSHEIRAPLAALAAALEVMQRRRTQLPEKSAYALDVLGEQIAGFQQLVVDLLEISRIDAGRTQLELEPVQPAALVRHAAAAVGVQDVAIRVDPDVPEAVLLDRRRMGQVVMNLLENARRYAGGATAISIERDGAVLQLAVCDRGPGVPADEQTRIFERFERGQHGVRGPRGTGLGLALVAEHAALHGGRAFVEDGDGGGARFVVEVPLCEPD